MKELIELCRKQGLTLSACESLTAGLFMASLADVPGCSAVLKGGFVTYSNAMKTRLAHVPESLLETEGAVSEACAVSMAENTRAITGTDLAVSFTGNAGPDVLENKPAGLVYCAIAEKGRTESFKFQFGKMERNLLRENVVHAMAQNLAQMIEEKEFGEESNRNE